MSGLVILVGRCGHCGELWPACTCGRWEAKPVLDPFEPEPALDVDEKPDAAGFLQAMAELHGVEFSAAMPSPQTTEGEKTMVEWVQWRGRRDGKLSLYHVRVSSAGWLLCGRKAPDPATDGYGATAADSFPRGRRCKVCLSKLGELAS